MLCFESRQTTKVTVNNKLISIKQAPEPLYVLTEDILCGSVHPLSMSLWKY